MSSKKSSLVDLNSRLQDIDGNYELISRVRYLPKRTSKAISREYLNAILTNSNVWTPEASTVRHTYHYQGSGAEALLNALNVEVKKLGKMLFLTEDTMPDMPDMQWMKDCLLLLLKEDKMGFLSRTPKYFRLNPEEVLALASKREVSILPA